MRIYGSARRLRLVKCRLTPDACRYLCQIMRASPARALALPSFRDFPAGRVARLLWRGALPTAINKGKNYLASDAVVCRVGSGLVRQIASAGVKSLPACAELATRSSVLLVSFHIEIHTKRHTSARPNAPPVSAPMASLVHKQNRDRKQ